MANYQASYTKVTAATVTVGTLESSTIISDGTPRRTLNIGGLIRRQAPLCIRDISWIDLGPLSYRYYGIYMEISNIPEIHYLQNILRNEVYDLYHKLKKSRVYAYIFY